MTAALLDRRGAKKSAQCGLERTVLECADILLRCIAKYNVVPIYFFKSLLRTALLFTTLLVAVGHMQQPVVL